MLIILYLFAPLRSAHAPLVSAGCAHLTLFAQSFLTGRRPATTGVYNFIDHFRQAECTNNEADRAFSGDVLRTSR